MGLAGSQIFFRSYERSQVTASRVLWVSQALIVPLTTRPAALLVAMSRERLLIVAVLLAVSATRSLLMVRLSSENAGWFWALRTMSLVMVVAPDSFNCPA